MPRIDREQVGVAFDMHGCPNRCRHCWLGADRHPSLSEEDVRWGVSRFREHFDGAATPTRRLSISTWFREPDYGDDYRRLHELEAELSDGDPRRYELLSVWRLARDETYADWAKSVGPDTCQISLFGMRETTDWFHRRPGAFDDVLAATERLLDAGMIPRWQVFLTTKLLPELSELLELVEGLRLEDRVRALGGEFVLFLHPPSPDHEARGIEGLRPAADEIADLPEPILERSRAHFGRRELWRTEASLLAEILDDDDGDGVPAPLPEDLWFLVSGNWDVFSNLGTLEPWWRLGNLKEDPVETVLHRFEVNEAPGLRALFHASPAELAKTWGRPTSRKIYSNREDLLSRCRGALCEERWNRR